MGFEREFLKYSEIEMLTLLPVVVSDLKFSADKQGREITNANIRRGLYFSVIRNLHSPERFEHSEKIEHQVGIMVKGYTRDVWDYLQSAYDTIHNTDFEFDYADLLISYAT